MGKTKVIEAKWYHELIGTVVGWGAVVTILALMYKVIKWAIIG